MPNQESESNTIETKDGTAEGQPGEIANVDSAAPEAETVPSAGPQAVDEAASRIEFNQLKAERDQLVDRIARLQAEFENARKRAEREKAEFRDYATGNVVEQFLPVIDNFELALKATGSADQLRSGVELIVKQMEEIQSRLLRGTGRLA
jgi:molecular chaperone GrpE